MEPVRRDHGLTFPYMENIMKNRIWILGAPDPEMELIERLLQECDETIIHAFDENGRRVHPGNAYRCSIPSVPEGATVYAVECIDKLPVGWVRIDHHRPGDPGYGCPPEEFMSASSLGQVISELARTGALRRAVLDEIIRWMTDNRGLLPPEEYNKTLNTQWFWTRQNMPDPNPYASYGTIARGVSWLYDGYAVAVHRTDIYFEPWVALIPSPLILAAAADHCLAAAYRGECPGVDPDVLLDWRIKTRAAFQGRSEQELRADVQEAQDILEDAPNERLAHAIYVADMRGYGHIPELPEAAMLEDVAYITLVADRDGRQKVVLGGHTDPETVRAFMDKWAPAQGLVDIYGDPVRGFAGGYLEPA